MMLTPLKSSAGAWGPRSFSDLEQRGRGALPPARPTPKQGGLFPCRCRGYKRVVGFAARSHFFPWGGQAGRGQGPRQGQSPSGFRGPDYLRVAARKARWVFPPGLPAAPTAQPAESAQHGARKTAAAGPGAEAARRGGERGAAGAGTAPALSAAHLPTPLVGAHVEEAEGCPGCMPALRDFPYRRGGLVQGPGQLPAQVAVANVLVEKRFEAFAHQTERPTWSSGRRGRMQPQSISTCLFAFRRCKSIP